MTGEQWRQYRRAQDSDLTGHAMLALLFECLSVAVAGWENVSLAGTPLAFDAARLAEVLTIEEAWELYHAAGVRCELDEGDKKN
jgi:hypothetical protein